MTCTVPPPAATPRPTAGPWFALLVIVLIVAGFLGVVYTAWEWQAADFRARHHCVYLFGQWWATESMTDRRFCQ